MRTIRVTSIPRESSPGAAYHPVYFAEKNADEIWSLPGKGAVLARRTKVRQFFFEGLSQRLLPRAKFWRGFAMLALFPRILSTGEARFFVHSYVFALPFCLLSRKPVVIIHGTDRRWLSTRVGRYIARKSAKLFAIGPDQVVDGIEVKGIPNVFALNHYVARVSDDVTRWQVAFVLRDAPVKNPGYPEKLGNSIGDSSTLRIGVVGLDGPAGQPESGKPASNVDYLGVIGPEEVANVLCNAAVLIIPSQSEGVSKAMLEGLAAGCTVLLSDSIVIPSELKPVVVQMDLSDYPKVIDHIEQALASPVRNEQGAASVKQYLQRATNQLAEIYS